MQQEQLAYLPVGEQQKLYLLNSVATGQYETLTSYLRGDPCTQQDGCAAITPINNKVETSFRGAMQQFISSSLPDAAPLDLYFDKIAIARAQIAKRDFKGTEDKVVNSLVGPALLRVTDNDLVREAALRSPEKFSGEHLERWKTLFDNAPPKGVMQAHSPLQDEHIDQILLPPLGNKRMIVSLASTKGQKKTMEDTYAVGEINVREQNIPFLGLFDGHGGSATAQFLSQNCQHILEETLSLLGKPLNEAHQSELENILTALTVRAEQARRMRASSSDYSGSTCIMAILLDDAVWVINTGDSRILALQGNETYQLTEDANPTSVRFLDGIRKRGGYFMYGRVAGCLAVARALGDKEIPGISPRSKVTRFPLSSGKTTTLIIGCDGLFDVNTSRKIANTYQAEPSAKALIQKAYTSGSKDNISVIVVTIPAR